MAQEPIIAIATEPGAACAGNAALVAAPLGGGRCFGAVGRQQRSPGPPGSCRTPRGRVGTDAQAWYQRMEGRIQRGEITYNVVDKSTGAVVGAPCS